jgi:DNA repair protein RadC
MSRGSSWGVKSLPAGDRPRERLVRWGPERLTSIELLSILLRHGNGRSSSMALAHRLLERFGGPAGVARAGLDELVQVRGVGPVKACEIRACVELGRRMRECRPREREVIRGPEDVAGLLMDEMRGLDREHFRAIYLNTKNRVLRIETISIGSLNASIIHPREILKPAIGASAAGIILVHNHPTGIPTPSTEDVEFTRRFAACGEILGIELLDHVIIGDGRFVSLKERGEI